ncbi:hypothetical protein D3C78_1864780 [compost metagenome]
MATGNTLEMLLAQGVIPVIIENEAAMSPDVVCDTGIALAVSVAELLKTGLPGEGD